MRVMNLPPFPQRIKIIDLESLYRMRLSLTLDLRTSAAIPLLCYMGWPNDSAAREAAMEMLSQWLETGQVNDATRHLAMIDKEWGHVADLVHLHFDMDHGGHQKSRGGPSIGKVTFLLSKTAKIRGTRPANVWKSWKKHKDVGHLIAAAVLVCADMHTRHRKKSLGLNLQQLLPFRVVLLVPELIIAVGLTYEKYGLDYVPKGGIRPMFNHQTIWHIPTDINVVPLAPPARKIRPQDARALIARRAGNRGRAKRINTTLVSA